MASQKCLVLKIVVDVILLAAGCLAILFYRLYGVTYKRGFFCDDDSIRYPYKTPLISDVALHLTCLLTPLTVIILNEYWMHSRKGNDYESQSQLILCSWSIPTLLVCLYHKIGIFFFGAAMCGVINNMTKQSIGRLRPHFLDVCKPSVNCTTGEQLHIYITDFTCNGNDLGLIDNARLSFPSGHALAVAYSMIYAILYIHFCVHLEFANLLKPFLQFVIALMAWFIALSRLSDNMHHWDDILGGMLIGSFVAVITVYFISDFTFTKTQNEESALYTSIASGPSTGYKTMG